MGTDLAVVVLTYNEEANLPDVLVHFIPEHHGTQEISFFYEQAKKGLGEGEELDPEEYCYPGPRPQSRETAIVMLADSVESAKRRNRMKSACRFCLQL